MKILDPSLKVKAGMPVSLAPINSMKMNLLLDVKSDIDAKVYQWGLWSRKMKSTKILHSFKLRSYIHGACLFLILKKEKKWNHRIFNQFLFLCFNLFYGTIITYLHTYVQNWHRDLICSSIIFPQWWHHPYVAQNHNQEVAV